MVHVITLGHSLGMPNTNQTVYYRALKLAFSCLQRCTLTFWGMFSLFISVEFWSATCWCSVSIHTWIDVASIMFAEECCYSFIFMSLEHIRMVLCLQSSGLIMMKQQVVSWTDCVIRTFIYLFQTWLRLSDTSSIFPIMFSWFPIFSTRKDSVNVLCWDKVTPEPFDHVVLSCRLPGEKKKYFFVDRFWCCEFSSQVAFISLCRRKRRFIKKCFVLSFHCSTYFL